MTLEHNHPPGNMLKAFVDVRLLLNTLKSTDTRVGEWVNVMGYITMTGSAPPTNHTIPIQAIVLWASGPLKLDVYERSLDAQKVDKNLNGNPT